MMGCTVDSVITQTTHSCDNPITHTVLCKNHPQILRHPAYTLSRNPYSATTHSILCPRTAMGYDRVSCTVERAQSRGREFVKLVEINYIIPLIIARCFGVLSFSFPLSLSLRFRSPSFPLLPSSPPTA